MNTLVITVCLVGPLLAFDEYGLLREHGPPINIKRSSRSTKEPELHHIIQRLDNFNTNDLRTWSMRYYSNGEFFQNGGPIFIYLGGEWIINNETLRGGQIFEMAQQHNGYMFYTEHRYYGFSYPTRNTSAENLKYLTTEQALADIVYFIRHVKGTIEGLSNSKVVVVGCSYAANLATWIRLRYPDVIDAAYASSGPVKAIADNYEYLEAISNHMDFVCQECKPIISDAFAQLEEKLKSDEGISEMSKAFRTCVPIRNTEPDRSHFFFDVISNIAGATHYGGIQLLLYYSGTALEKVSNFIRNRNGNSCMTDYREYIKKYTRIENNSDYKRPWMYQACTEYGYYQTTTSEKQPFGRTIALEHFIQRCTDLYGENFGLETLENGINRTNTLYGALTPNVTKVLSVHGSADPWHRLGILKDLNSLAPAIFIKGSRHCEDIGSNGDFDSYALKEARRRARRIISQWIK